MAEGVDVRKTHPLLNWKNVHSVLHKYKFAIYFKANTTSKYAIFLKKEHN